MKPLLTLTADAGLDLFGLAQRLWVHVQQMPVKMIDTLLHWQQLAAQRRMLAGMNDHLLKDIGISRADAEREARRPFWDDPLKQEQWRSSGR